MFKRIIFIGLVVGNLYAMQNPQPINDQLYYAVARGDIDHASKLLGQGVNPNAPYSRNLLGIAAADKDLQMLQLLLEHGADPGPIPNILCDVIRIYELQRPGPQDLKTVKRNVMDRLIRHPNTNLNCVDGKGRTPYLYVLEKKDTKLLAEFAKPEIQARMNPVLNRWAMPQSQPMPQPNFSPRPTQPIQQAPIRIPAAAAPAALTPIVQVIKEGNVFEMGRWIAHGININAPTQVVIEGKTLVVPLMWVAIHYNQLPIVDLLLSYPAFDPNHGPDGLTVLMKAVQKGNNKDIVARLLQDPRVVRGINLEDNQKITALDIANQKKNTPVGAEIVRMLIDKGAAIGSRETNMPILAIAGRPNVPEQAYVILGTSFSEASPEKILGVAQGASQEEINKAYRRLAREYHTDKYKGEYGKEIFQLVKWAVDSLRK